MIRVEGCGPVRPGSAECQDAQASETQKIKDMVKRPSEWTENPTDKGDRGALGLHQEYSQH